MLCQNCHKRTASVHFSQIINNNKIEMYLCEQCAKEKEGFNFASPLSINDFFTGLMGAYKNAPYMSSVPQKMICKKCGMSFEDFQKIGKLGCENCYNIYGRRLDPVLKRLHGDIEHKGKIATAGASKGISASKEIEKQKEELNQAIQNEEYEKAAEIRDKIKRLEAGKS